MKIIPIKRALLSVSDKTGLLEFAKILISLNVEIISTGGTSQLLKTAGIPHKQVDEMTGLVEMLGGRVKTLHPKIHGGILGRRDEHAVEAIQHGIDWIDLVVVNFYPFAKAIAQNTLSLNEAIEYVDIGGPTMVRGAAKNYEWVGAVVDPHDYEQLGHELLKNNGLSLETRKNLAAKVFALTATYDAMVHDFFLKSTSLPSESPHELNILLERKTELRYGENPHQKAFAYQLKNQATGLLSAHQYQGKPLSYNNIVDAEAALACVHEFNQPACVIVKHANPCGVAQSEDITLAYQKAYLADATSAFGGIVALNRPCTLQTAQQILGIFTEVIIAPAYTEEALALFASKPNLRVLVSSTALDDNWEMRFITGGMLLQEKDKQALQLDDLKVVTKVKPSERMIEDLLFAWSVVKHIKSNAILIAKDNATVGIGAGQVSRIAAVDIAVRKAGENIMETVLASDAFFPFPDSILRIANTGIRAVIQPGGSVKDNDVIDACNDAGIGMVFTGRRCFKH